ncbi:MAG: GAF domain-containing sensor histidine kinase [Anaerolineae bacterium]|nr:GAF domain-containing sensor histidine kinase [Anaerolineae bacterium]
MPGSSLLLSAILIAVYGGIIIWMIALRRRPRRIARRRWLLLALVAAWAANWVGLLPRDAPAPYDALLPGALTAPALAILATNAALVFFGALLLSYLRSRAVAAWLAVGSAWWLAQAAACVSPPGTILGQAGWYSDLASAADWAAWLVIGGWLLGGVALMLTALAAFYRAALPELANQALFGAVIVPPMVVGVALAASGERIVTEIGLLLQLAGFGSAAYSATAYRVFDIRRIVRLTTAAGLLTLVTALATFGAALLATGIDATAPGQLALLAALALAAAAIATPLHALVQHVLAGLLGESRPVVSRQLRQFSADMGRAVELDDLVEVTLRTLRDLLRARRGGFLLVTHHGENDLEIEAVPRLDEIPEIRGWIAANGPVGERFLRARAPLLQYDLDFSPDFAAVPLAERQLFAQTRMSAYAPVIVHDRLIGIICCGPKTSDDPFSAHDLELLMTIANQTGAALRSARLIADLRRREAEQMALNRALSATTQQLEKLNSVKTDFITIASHELRTPLAQIRGFAEIMESMNDEGLLDQDQIAGMTASIRHASDRLEELIAAMLDVSELDVDALSLHFAPLRLEAVVRSALEPLTDAVRQRKLMVAARGLRDLPAISGDEPRLVQAFRNVILNAIKYTPDGGRIDITGRIEGDEATVAIRDSGIGIDPALLDLVFEKFFRAQDPNHHSTGATKFMGGGPGLGLTIARGVVQAHGGRIWAESVGSDPERCPGSTFTVALPLTPPDLAQRLDELELTVRLGRQGERSAAAIHDAGNV